MNAKHTQGKISIGNPSLTRGTYTLYTTPFGTGDIAEVYNKEDANRLKLCWNTHDELLEACKEAVNTMCIDGTNNMQYAIEKCRKAISKAATQ